MLERLVVRNLVLIRDADVEPHRGLNVITGETGAGKTILTQALGLVLGGPAEASLVGSAGAEAYVEATFDVAPGVLEREAFDGVRDLIGEPADGLVLARRITAEGRGRALVCGRAASRAALESAADELVRVVSQHEARALTRPAVQRRLLDSFAGPDQALRIAAMTAAWRELAAARQTREAAEADAGDADRLIGDLTDLVARVERVAPEPGEEIQLLADRERLRHADALLAAAGGAGVLISPDDGDGAAALASRAARTLGPAEGFDPLLAEIAAEVRDATVRLEEAAHALHAYVAGIDADPARLDAVEHRLAALDDLTQRHGSVDAAIAAAAAARERLERLERRDDELARLAAAEETARGNARECADALSDARRATAGPFARAVERHLADLGMGDARVEIVVLPVALGPAGADDVRLEIAPNPGAAAGRIGEIASGGELARVTLAVRVAAQEQGGVPTLLFDEVDAGVGGRTARAVADKLLALSGVAQVICVTHLPQIAARADRHFRVVKEPGDPTVTRIELLAGDEVEAELARMLGADEGDETALELARTLRSS